MISLYIFLSIFFSAELIIEALKNRKTFEILHAVMAVLVRFGHFSGKLCSNFLALILSASPNIMHFVRTFLIVRV